MDIKDVLLLLSAEAPCEEAVEMAARLAREHGAMVDAVCLFAEPPTGAADSFAEGREGVADAIEHRQAKVRALTGAAEALYRTRLAGSGLGAGWRVVESLRAADEVLALARLADLVILAHPSRDGGYRALAETLPLTSGAPCLLVPGDQGHRAAFARIVLAWNGSREARRAMDDALPFLKRAAAVAVVVAGGEPLRSAELSDELVRHLARHGVPAELIRDEGRGRGAGRVLLERCAAFGADLLVMGAFGHSRAAELVLGGATRTILAETRLPTLLSH